MVPYEPVIGLEVHAQLLTVSKAFCGCSAAFGAPPNSHVCPVCLGLPGSLPVLNGHAVELAVRAALALGCRIRPRSVFARKHYFYPDQPKGYQISQYDEPFSEGGCLEVPIGGAPGEAPRVRRVRITRVHMEEDAGKNVHATGEDSIVDLNRSGVPLIEIVGEPDLRSGSEAAEYLRLLREILLFLRVSDGNLEEGSFRCDANVSVRRVGDEAFGTRVELKNINSFRFVEKAIDHEASRQIALLEAGETLHQETRGWDEKTGATYSLRSKEEAQDYRYFPDPDLPLLLLPDAFVEQVRAASPELPAARRRRFVEVLGLSVSAAEVLTQHPVVAAFFEDAAARSGLPLKTANFVLSEVLRDVTTHGIEADVPVSAAQLAGLLALVEAGAISGKQAKEVYARLRDEGRAGRGEASAEQVVQALGLVQVSDEAAIEEACRAVVVANPRQAAAFRAGKQALLGFFVGLVMKETRGRANPGKVNAALLRLLGGS
jgi:aspartyl-tRNA(Asn)/glutamyl-tRNA(Gln) amidotransferase subunit B